MSNTTIQPVIKKKILQVSEAFGGGIFHSVTRLCKSLEDDFSFTFLLSIRSEAPKDFEKHFPMGSVFHKWSACKSVNPFKDLKALIELINYLKKEKPDIVHAHSSKAGALTRISQLFVKVPVIYSPRGYAFLRLDFSFVKRLLFYLIEYILGRTSTVTVACSLGELMKARKVARKSVYISNMISLDDFSHIEKNRSFESDNTFVMVGRLCKQKNPELFFNIAREFTNQSMKFLWIGDVGHGEKYEPVSIPSNAEITGWLPRDQVLDLVSKCRLFIQTSLWEGLPIALLEAMALEKAILAKPCIGNTELIIDGFNGYLCNTLGDFIPKIMFFNSNFNLLNEFGKNSRKLINEKYLSINIAPQWRSLYDYYDRYSKYLNY